MNTNASALIVPPGSADALTNDIRGLKPLVEIPSSWGWVWWVLAVMLLALLCAWAWRRWRSRVLVAPPIPVIPPHIRARQKLERALSLISDPKAFCILVSDTIRIYLEERFDFRAPERTTEEFLLELQGTDHLAPDQKESLGAFLQSCDLVKFARFEPTEGALHELLESARRLIDETQFDSLETQGVANSVAPPRAAPPASDRSLT